MSTVSFSNLISPVETKVFLERYWQRRHLQSQPCVDVGKLVSLRDVEYLLSSLSTPDTNWIKITRSGSAVRPSTILTQQGHVGLVAIYEAYQAGYTIQLAKIHKRWASIGRLCRDVEHTLTRLGVALARPVGAHLHLAPPHAMSRGPHYHTHDNLVVQIAGSKHWKLYDAVEPFPVEPLAGDLDRNRLPPLEAELRLAAGEALYVPRGVVHEAETEDAHSLHVTLDVTLYTWADLFSRMMLTQPRFREGLPLGAWQGLRPSQGLLQGYRQRCLELKSGDLKPIATAMFAEFLEKVDTLPSSGFEVLHQLAAISLDTIVRQRPGAFACMIADGEKSKLYFPGSAFGAPGALREALTAIADWPRFAVRELPNTLGDENKIDIVKEFIREGFLEIADDEPEEPQSQ